MTADGGDGDGGDATDDDATSIELANDISDDLAAGEVIGVTVSVPDHSLLVVRARAPTDAVAGVLADEDVAASCGEAFAAMADAGTDLGGLLHEPFPTVDLFDADGSAPNHDPSLADQAPPMVVQVADDGGEGDDEMLVVPFLEGAEVEVVVFDYNAEASSIEAYYEVIEVDDPEGDPVTFAENIADDEEFRSKVPDAPF